MTRSEKRRALLFLGILLTLFSGIVLRLYHVQVRNHQRYDRMARKQHRRRADIKPWRGDIYFRERDRRVLVAGSVGRHSILVHGRQEQPERLIKGLTEVLKLDNSERSWLRRRIARGRSFWLRRRGVSHAEAARLRKSSKTLVKIRPKGAKRSRFVPKIAGIDIYEEPVRLYPFGKLGAHVLGLVNVDGKGQSGVEASFDEQLKGLEGFREFEIDNRRRQLANVNSVSVPALPGYSVVLTLDRRIQYFVEEAMDAAEAHWKPKGISVVAVEPSTGRVLALASRPTFNPEDPGATPSSHYANRLLTHPYEPGSTIKPLLVSLVWQAGKGAPTRSINLPQRLRVKGRRKPIEDSHQVRVKERGTREHDVIVQSSNVGSYLLANRLSDAELEAAFKLFGLGRKTGIPLWGEGRGNLALVHKLNTGNRAALAQGYGLLVTPLQMVLAYAAIANGGTLYKPRLAYELRDAEGNLERRFEPIPIARVLTDTVAKEWMTPALSDVVNSKYGTARRQRIEGYKMAGKTGTSKKLVRSGNSKRSWHYSPSRTVCSFIGFAPVDNPRIAIAVVVDDPTTKHGRTFGGNVAAPIAKEVVGKALKYLGVPQTVEDEDESRPRTARASGPTRRRRST